jgi:hypothetical protein
VTPPGGALQRDPFACSVALRRFECWQAAVTALAVAALAVLAGWGASDRGDAVAVAGPWLAAAVACAAIGVIGLALLLLQVDAGILAREAGRWTFAPFAAGSAGEPQPGDLAVALDLGPFMLLVFDRRDAGMPSVRRWLPVQRLGLEREWQALRCAVHAPRTRPPGGVAVPE